MISGQKQLSSCPTGERAATVEKMLLTRSSKKRRQSLRNSFQSKLLFIFSRDDSRRVPSTKWSSWMSPKHELIGSMYASDFSMTGKSLLRFTFCSRQNTNWESSPSPDGHNRFAQSPVHWSCVHLKKTQIMTRDWHGNSHLSLKWITKWGKNQQWHKNFRVCRRGDEESTRSATQNSSLPWAGANQKYAQKTAENPQLAQETMKVPQPPKNCSKLCKRGINMDIF